MKKNKNQNRLWKCALPLVILLSGMTAACNSGNNETNTTDEMPVSSEVSVSENESETEGMTLEQMPPETSNGEIESDTENMASQPTEEDETMWYQENIRLTGSYKLPGQANPIMTQKFGADPYAMEYNGRVYFYMTGDVIEYNAAGEIVENTYAKVVTLRIVSTDDMVNFTDHGEITVAGRNGVASWANNSWAPAAAWKNIDGEDRFFLYFANSGGGIGVLTGDSPVGPFTDPIGGPLISRQTPNCGNVLWLFDPAVLVDDDGRGYLYFGGGVPEGMVAHPNTARVVELGEDMISIVGEAQIIDAPYLFEDSGIHAFGGKYYYTYCTNWQVDAEGTAAYGFHNAEIVCMESDSPMGPFTFKETILENPGKYCGLYGNNHHCVFSFEGQWYITYHTRRLEKAMNISGGYRSTSVEAITIQEDGSIGKISQTQVGPEQLRYVDPYTEQAAVTVATMAGVNAVAGGAFSEASGYGMMALGEIHTGDYVEIRGVDFGDKLPTQFTAKIRNPEGAKGAIRICLDRPNGEVLGYLVWEEASEEFVAYQTVLEQSPEGVHDLYFVFLGEGYEVSTWQFQ